eukprot:6177082-Pleurochrysis_carterae.AAC.2
MSSGTIIVSNCSKLSRALYLWSSSGWVGGSQFQRTGCQSNWHAQSSYEGAPDSPKAYIGISQKSFAGTEP